VFCKQVIVPILPFREPLDFREFYGVNTDEMASLIKDEKVLPIVTIDHESYATWYNCLFSVSHVPSARNLSLRILSKYGTPGKRNFKPDADLFLSSMLPLKQKIAKIDPEYLSDLRIAVRQVDLQGYPGADYLWSVLSSGVPTHAHTLLRAACGTAMSLMALGYDEIVQNCGQLEGPETSFLSLAAAEEYLVNPLLSLDGITLGTRALPDSFKILTKTVRHLGRMSRFGFLESLRAKLAGSKSATMICPSQALLTELAIRLNYGHPENMKPLDFIARIKTRDVEKNQLILLDAQRRLEKMQFQEAFDRLHEAREVVKDIDSEVARIGRQYKITRYVLYPAFSIVSGLGASTLLSALTEISGSATFPLFLSGATLAALGTATVTDLKKNLNTLAEMLVSTVHGRHSAPFLIWQRELTKPGSFM
jgi:hypothetical protein